MCISTLDKFPENIRTMENTLEHIEIALLYISPFEKMIYLSHFALKVLPTLVSLLLNSRLVNIYYFLGCSG